MFRNYLLNSYEYHQSVIDNARAAEKSKPGRPLAIALDTVSLNSFTAKPDLSSLFADNLR